MLSNNALRFEQNQNSYPKKKKKKHLFPFVFFFFFFELGKHGYLFGKHLEGLNEATF